LEIEDAYALLELPEDFDIGDLDAYFGPKVAEALADDDYDSAKEFKAARDLVVKYLEDENREFNQVLKILETSSKSILIMGKAGTGKSRLIRQILAESREGYAACASTGVAAINIEVSTVHSLFGIGSKVIGQDQEFFKKYSTDKLEILKRIKTLIIDEISMVNADLLDTINKLFQMAHKNAKQFGGVRIVMVGDPFQLGPIPPREKEARDYLKAAYPSLWFFDAMVWSESASTEGNKFQVFELTQARRQADKDFVQVLDNIRGGVATTKDFEYLNKRCYGKKPRVAQAVKLAGKNDKVDDINFGELAKIKEPEVKFTGQELSLVAGTKFIEEGMRYPAEKELILKKGAHVMFVKNDDQNESAKKRWANGTTGIITGFGENNASVFVRIDEEIVEVVTSTWTKPVYTLVEVKDPIDKQDKKVLKAVDGATYTQIPLRLAWAITIHKSQGQTYDNVVVDLHEGTWAGGQAYVALSRVREIEGMVLEHQITPQNVKVDTDAKLWLSRTSILNKPSK
jgi:ATP-dependent exoDNAse (exonuclease V) alpha subunit